MQIEKMFQTKQLTMQQYPEPPKTALKCGNAHKLANTSFMICYTKITTFPTFGYIFLTFLWRCGNAVPTRSGGVGTPFPRVSLGNDPRLYGLKVIAAKIRPGK